MKIACWPCRGTGIVTVPGSKTGLTNCPNCKGTGRV